MPSQVWPRPLPAVVFHTCPPHPRIRWVDCVLNVMAHTQKPDFVFRRNGRVHLNRRGRQFSRILVAEVRISGSNAGYTMFRGSLKGTGYPLHSPVSPPLLLPCVTVCHHVSTGLYLVHFPRCMKQNHQFFFSIAGVKTRGFITPHPRYASVGLMLN